MYKYYTGPNEKIITEFICEMVWLMEHLNTCVCFKTYQSVDYGLLW